MKKESAISIFSIILLLTILSTSLSSAITAPPAIGVCSNGVISAAWDSVFKLGSANLVIVKNNSNGCYFTAIKNISNELYLFTGLNVSNGTTYHNDVIAIRTKVNDSDMAKLYAVTTLSSSEIGDQGLDQWYELTKFAYLLNVAENSFNRTLWVNSTSDANTRFGQVFEGSASFQVKDIVNNINTTFESESNETIILNNGVEKRRINSYLTGPAELEIIFMGSAVVRNSSSCTTNWTAVTNNSCRTDDTYVVWYNDTNACPSPTNRPANITNYCDYDKNGIIGNTSTITQTNLVITTYINSSIINITRNWSSSSKIEFREGNVSRVFFDYPFTSALNLRNISIERQSSSSKFGYLIVKGLHLTKTFTIDKINSTSNKVCVKNLEIDNITQISDNCVNTSEYLVNCPGTASGYSCNISNGKFVVSGLSNSAVKEITSNNSQTCVESWSCTDWNICISGEHTRTCTDINSCGTITDKPTISEPCDDLPACTPSWSCTDEDWTPVDCPSEGVQTRLCIDANDCNVLTGKPAESRICEYKSNSKILIIISIILVLLLIAGTVVIVFFIVKKNKNTSGFYNSTTSNQF